MEVSVHACSFLIIVIFLFILIHNHVKANEYEDCRRPFLCGNVTLSYPFNDVQSRPEYCGYPGFEVECNEGNEFPEISVSTRSSERFYLLHMDPDSQTISVAREDLWSNYCPEDLHNTTLNITLYNFAPMVVNVTLYYDCQINQYQIPSAPSPYQFTCTNSTNPAGFFIPYPYNSLNIPTNSCTTNIFVPVNESAAARMRDPASLQNAFQNGFNLQWIADNRLCDECRASGGAVCGYNTSERRFTCYHGRSSSNKAIAIGASVGSIVVAAVLACGSIFLVRRRRRRALSEAESKDLGPSNLTTSQPLSNGFQSSQGYTTSPSTYMSQSTPSYPSSKSDFEKSADYLGVPVFSFDELEEATNKFHESQELGDGGFGTVYYGKLYDGRLVAVKRLYENSCRHMGQFLNEIHILARLRHKNLVTLYGCTSRKSRDLLLVYEYISNGTVADHLHGKLAESNVLPWSTRLNIAVETAEALTFLHENDVIHRDVKTTNILLENSFRVKVADFGLSRLFPNDVTHVSTAPQGTPGYVDPEYYQCYQLTEKSDVYSFGVVLAELISSKMAVDITRHRHDINLANMAVDRIQKHALEELVDPKLGFETEFLAQKMVKLVAEVAFQCLQQEKDARPSMKEVLESLKGIQKEMENAQKQVVVDIRESDDDVGLLKNASPPLSPETKTSIKSIR